MLQGNLSGMPCRQLLSKFWWRATLHQKLREEFVNKVHVSSDCPAVYVGQTGQNISKEHKYALTSRSHVSSAVVEHIINRREICILDSHLNLHQRCILESWHICTRYCSNLTSQTETKHSYQQPIIYQLIHTHTPFNYARMHMHCTSSRTLLVVLSACQNNMQALLLWNRYQRSYASFRHR